MFFGYFHHPDAEIFGALLQFSKKLRFDLFALGSDGLALDRNQLAVDELSQRRLEHPQFFGKLEVHHASPVVVRQITRTSTAVAPPFRTLIGLISMSSIF